MKTKILQNVALMLHPNNYRNHFMGIFNLATLGRFKFLSDILYLWDTEMSDRNISLPKVTKSGYKHPAYPQMTLDWIGLTQWTIKASKKRKFR